MQRQTARSVGEVLAERVRRYREQQGLRQEDVADRCVELGYPMSRVTLAKLEAGGTRSENASLAEVLVLAAALDVPPPLLFLPLGDDEEMAITPNVTVHPHLVLDWLAGDEAFTMSNRFARNLPAWHRNAQPLFLFRRLRELQDAVHRDASDENLKRLADHLTYMVQAGLRVPDMPAEWRDRMEGL